MEEMRRDRKSTRLNSSHLVISYAVFCLKKELDGRPSFARACVSALAGRHRREGSAAQGRKGKSIPVVKRSRTDPGSAEDRQSCAYACRWRTQIGRASCRERV